jgi:hypothetical protein
MSLVSGTGLDEVSPGVVVPRWGEAAASLLPHPVNTAVERMRRITAVSGIFRTARQKKKPQESCTGGFLAGPSPAV